MSIPISVSAETNKLDTRTALLVNNHFSECDYKLSNEEFEKYHEYMLQYTDLNVADRDETDISKDSSVKYDLKAIEDRIKVAGNIEETSKNMNWLIKHNILTRPVKISFAQNGVQVEQVSTKDCDVTSASRSEFLTLLYKSKLGVIQSPIIYQSTLAGRGATFDKMNSNVAWGSDRSDKNKYWDSSSNIGCVVGNDYIGYISPNVYELYFKELVELGVVNLDEFDSTKGVKFKDTIYNTKSSWQEKTALSIANASNSLGYSNNVSNNTITEKWPEGYFTNDTLTVYEALSYIYDFLSIEETTMSDTETSIIAFKYGLQQFYSVPEQFKPIVYYAVAAGIIPYDDTVGKFSLSGNLTVSQMYELIYRIANKSARFNFSEVTMTDIEKEFQNKGYSKSSISMFSTSSDPYVREYTSKKEPKGSKSNVEVAYSSKVKSLFSDCVTAILNPTIAYAASGSNGNKYYVTRWFDYEIDGQQSGNIYTVEVNSNVYSISTSDGTYKAALTNNTVDAGDGVNAYKAIEELQWDGRSGTIYRWEDVSVDQDGKTIKCYKVTFITQATSAQMASQNIQSKLSYDARKTTLISGYSTVKNAGRDETDVDTVISQTALREFECISVLRDKVLLNTETGAQALFVDDANYNYALVGNTIFTDSDLIIFSENGEVYYNLDIILHLLSSNFAVKNLGIGENADLQKSILKGSDIKDYKADISYDIGDFNSDRKAFYLYFSGGKDNSHYKLNSNQSNIDKIMYDMDSIVFGLNTIQKNITVNYTPEDGEGATVPVKIKMIVDFKYAIPDIEGESDDLSFDYDTLDSLEDYQNLRTTCPGIDGDSVDLTNPYAIWYLYNQSLCNKILNFMFDTPKDIDFVHTGYLIPNITFCFPHPNGDDQNIEVEYEPAETCYTDFIKDKWAVIEPYGSMPNSGDSETVCTQLLRKATSELNEKLGGTDKTNWWCQVFSGSGLEEFASANNCNYKKFASLAKKTYDFQAYYATRKEDGSVVYSELNGNRNDADGISKCGTYGIHRVLELSTGKTYLRTYFCTFYKTAGNTSDVLTVRKVNNKVTFTINTQDQNKINYIASDFKNRSIFAFSYIDKRNCGSINSYTADHKYTIQGWRVVNHKKTVSNSVSSAKGLAKYIALEPMFDLGCEYNGLFIGTLRKNTNIRTQNKCPYIIKEYAVKSLGQAMIDAGVYSKKPLDDDNINLSGSKNLIYNVAMSDELTDPEYNIFKQILAAKDFSDGSTYRIENSKGKQVTIDPTTSIIANTAGDLDGKTIKTTATGTLYYYANGNLYIGKSIRSSNSTSVSSNGSTVNHSNTKEYSIVRLEKYNPRVHATTKNKLGKGELKVRIVPRIYINFNRYKFSPRMDDGTNHFDYVGLSSAENSTDRVYTRNQNKFSGLYTPCDFYLWKKQIYSSLLDQNFYNQSIIQSVIGSQLDKDSGISKLNGFSDSESGIPIGSDLYIGKYRFYKSTQNNEWVSYPIKDTTPNNVYIQRLYEGKAAKVLKSMFNGMSMTSHGMSFSLYNYIDKDSISLGDPVYDGNSTNLNNELFPTNILKKGILLNGKEDEEVLFVKKVRTKLRSNSCSFGEGRIKLSDYDYYTIKFKFTNEAELFGRPLNKDGTSWTLIWNTNENMLSNSALSIYDMDLDYNRDKSIVLSLNNDNFELADNIESAKLSFKQLYKSEITNSWYWFIKYAIAFYMIYLAFITWAIRMPGVKNVFKIFYHKETGKIDLLKITSFGILNLQREISVSRAVIITLLCAAIDALMIYIL